MDWFFSWMNNLVAKPKFHTLVKKLPVLNRMAAKDGRRIYDLVSGFVYSQVLLAMVELRLFKFLLTGKKNISDLSFGPRSTRRAHRARSTRGRIKT